MNHVLRVDVHQCLTDLFYVACSDPLCEPTLWLLLHFFIKLAFRCVLENQIDALFIVKKSVELQDIRMSQVALNFNLSLELVSDVCMQQLVLLHHLESHYEARVLFTCNENVAELTAAKLPTELKITQLPLLGFND